MTTQAIGSISPADNLETDHIPADEIPNIVSELESICDFHGYDMTFYQHDFGELPFSPSGSEEEFAKEVVEYLDGKDGLVQGDIVVVPHGELFWGYGKRFWKKASSGTGAHICLVYAGFDSVEWETRGFTRHEVGHAMWAGHSDGDQYLSNGKLHEISSMCMSYLHNTGGSPDTHFDGGGNEVSSFCGGTEDGEHDFKYGRLTASDRKANHSIGTYSTCTRESIRNWIEDKEG